MIAAVYARKSTSQEGLADSDRSVARQIEHARAYAARKGWHVKDAHIYVDDGISGAEFANRAGFVRLMNALKPRAAFQVLVMSEESRLGREAIETAYALKQLLTAGVRVFFYLEDRERTLESATDKILLSVTAFADELEREKARQRTYDALVRKARAGHVAGGRVFGYDNVDVLTGNVDPSGRPIRSHVERKINPAEAIVVRRVFELAAAGYGKKQIARLLNEDLAPAPKSQRNRPIAWAPSTIFAVLKRDLYRGVVMWNRSKKRDAWGAKRQRPRDPSEWLRTDAPQLRIVSDDLWEAAHTRLERRRAVYLSRNDGRPFGRPSVGTASPYLLTGFVTCGYCGGSMVVRTTPHRRVKHARFQCSCYRTRGVRGCVNRWQPGLEVLDETVLSAIEQDVLAPAVVEAAVAKAAGIILAEEVRSEAADPRLAREELANLRKRIANLTAAIADGADDVLSLVNALRALEARSRTLTALTSRSRSQRPPANQRARLEAQLRQRFDNWRDLLRGDVAAARPVLEILLAGRITVTPHQGSPTSAPICDVRIPLTTRGVFLGICGSEVDTSPAGFEPALPA
jgi:site-specific DNA recombinase